MTRNLLAGDPGKGIPEPSPHHVPPASPEPEMDEMDNPVFLAVCVAVILLLVVLSIAVLYCLYRYCKKDSRRRHSQQLYGYSVQPPPYTETGSPGYREPYPFRCQQQRSNQMHQYQPNSYLYGNDHRQPAPNVDRNQGHPNELPLVRSVGAYQQQINPIFHESSDNDSIVGDGIPPHLGELFQITNRSKTRTVGSKMVVSLTRKVGYQGDDLYLDNMGISLRVPRGAVRRGNRQLVSLVLNWDLSDNPDMTKEQSLVSPVVYVGPHGMRLEKECTLSYRHCAFDPRHIRVMRSETELTDEKNWETMCDRDDVSGSCALTQDECKLKINSFTLFTCIQTPLDNVMGKKWLQIAAFACPLRRNIEHHQIRLYFLNKTPCALQWAIQNEAQFGGKQVCPEKVFLFDGCEKDMLTKTLYFSRPWELVDIHNCEKINFLKIWHGHCPHISICYKRHTPSSELNLQLQLFQETMETECEKLVIQMTEDTVTPECEAERTMCRRHHIDELVVDINPHPVVHNRDTAVAVSAGNDVRPSGNPSQYNIRHDNQSNHSVSSSSNGSEHSLNTLRVVINNPQPSCSNNRDGCDTLARTARKREIPHVVRKQLKLYLDPKCTFGNDWRELASRLQLDQCIPYIQEQESPTESLLDFVERKGIPLARLQDILYGMDRQDAASFLEDFMQTSLKRVPVESSCDSSYTVYRGNQ